MGIATAMLRVRRHYSEKISYHQAMSSTLSSLIAYTSDAFNMPDDWVRNPAIYIF
ncbi:hypothetical protein Plhal304r1_c056g0141591 [Plasmopara halstedii]